MADENLEKKKAEARAAGYTDAEIDAWLNPKSSEQLNAETQKDRTEEYIGTGEFGLAKAAELAAEAYGAKKLIIDPVARAIAGRGIPGPQGPAGPAGAPAPTTFTGGANPAWDRALSQPYTPPANEPYGRPFTPARPTNPVIPGGQGMPAAPAQPPVPGTPAAQQGSTFIERMAQQYGKLAQQVAPVVQRAAPLAGPAAVGTGIVAVPGAMMLHDYNRWKKLNPEQQGEAAMESLSGTAPGQAW